MRAGIARAAAFWLLVLWAPGCEKEVYGPTSGSRASQDAGVYLPCEAAGDDRIKLAFTGDLVLGGAVGDAAALQHGGSFDFLFDGVRDCLTKADLVFANLESVPSLAGDPVNDNPKAKRYRADPRALAAVRGAGIGVVSVANDHWFDYGRAAMEDAFENLKAAGIAYAGGGMDLDEALAPAVFEIKGRTIALLAFTAVGNPASEAREEGTAPESSGIAWLTIKALESAIYKAREQADLVVVSMHFGSEYQTLPQNPRQDEFAHLAIERGADLVIGHHPRLLQPVMVYTGGYIAYSLGTLVSDDTAEGVDRGMFLEVTIGRDGTIGQVYRRYFAISEPYQPAFD